MPANVTSANVTKRVRELIEEHKLLTNVSQIDHEMADIVKKAMFVLEMSFLDDP
jgi:hypothetical protein